MRYYRYKFGGLVVARGQLEDCMFCGVPHNGNCASMAPKPKLSSVQRVRPAPKSHTPAVVSSESVTEQAAPREVGPPAKPADVAPQRRPNLSGVERIGRSENEALSYAVTLFAERDMLGVDSLTEHRDLINLPASRIDAMIWKQANRDAVRNNAGTGK